MSTTFTPEYVHHLAKAFGIAAGHETIRHDCGAWSVLLRFNVGRVRYFTVSSHFLDCDTIIDGNGMVLLRELGTNRFEVWCRTKSELYRCLSELGWYVERTGASQ
jgi:hypothetical protein